MYGIVYKVTCKLSNKCYIGQTTRTLSRRKTEHQNQAKNNSRSCKYFHNALIKYGFDNFEWIELYRANTKEELNLKEQEFIKEFNSFGKNGYNLCYGGDSNAGYRYSNYKPRKHTLEERQRASKRMLGTKLSEETKEKLRQHNLGKKHSLETKKKMSESNLGKGTKKIYCETNNKVYDSLTQASIELGIAIPQITLVAKGKRSHTKGYVFRYE